MATFLPRFIKRQVATAAVAFALMALMGALGLAALAAFALALYHRLLPDYGPELAWWISGGILLATALLVGAVLMWRLGHHSGPERRAELPEGMPALAVQMTELLKEQLPRNAVPATVLALLAGVAVGLNPEAVRGLVEGLRRKPD